MVDWGVILSGISGIPGGEALDAQFVRRVADAELSQMDVADPMLAEVSELSLFNNEQMDQARENLSRLCEARDVDVERGKRKWRVVALEELLSQLGSDPVYDLISLGEFWADWGEATNSPYVAQGVENNLTPTEFYTESNLAETLSRHREWLRKEENNLL
ncbi:hypothetical protein LMG19083_04579 [Ralstonia psammae]|uniref:DUF2247 domain-containing protein n=1 Tax=Ralstonia psammae TaxID=3058598 RepID=A0ABM9JY80_9RALS|nr:DUF2247 family protein [Ralstonia sp. LMG 19083]CAJ0807550.1 hypothetical protein LMG19083_04579 [Ralstonia sp. LMG 19083]